MARSTNWTRRAWLAWLLLLCAPAFATAPIITTFAGRADPFSDTPDGDGGPAAEAHVVLPQDVAVDAEGNVYIADYFGGQVRMVDDEGIIHTAATLPAPRGVAIATDGRLYVVNGGANVFRVETDGSHAPLSFEPRFAMVAHDVDAARDGSLLVSDTGNHRLVRLSPDGAATVIAGTGTQGNGGDGGPAAAAELDAPIGALELPDGSILVSSGTRVRIIAPDGTIDTFAGGGGNVAATSTTALKLGLARGLALDSARNVYVADLAQHLVRRVSRDGTVAVVAGKIVGDSGGIGGYAGDGGPATEAQLGNPRGIAIHGRSLYIAEQGNQRVRRVAPLPIPAKPADYDGDGTSDIIWRHAGEGFNQVWLAGRSGDRRRMRAVRNAEWDIVATGDFDGDGAADVFWRNVRTGANAVWPGAVPARTPVRGVANGEWLVEAAGDFDGDGHDDIFWRNMLTGTNAIWPGGQPGDVQVVAVRNHEWHVAGAGDFDGDGTGDVFWRNPYTGENVIWRSALYATQQLVEPMAEAGWTVAGIGDFGGDGTDDVLWRNYDTGENVIWPGGDAAEAQAVAGVARVSWVVAAVGDYDGDGDADILWRDRSSGRNVIWRDADHREQRAVGSVADQAWEIVPTRPWNATPGVRSGRSARCIRVGWVGKSARRRAQGCSGRSPVTSPCRTISSRIGHASVSTAAPVPSRPSTAADPARQPSARLAMRLRFV